MPKTAIRYARGTMSFKQYIRNAVKHKGAEFSQVVYVFPGDAKLMSKKSTLYSVKESPGNLGQAAKQISDFGYPTLCLPINNLTKWNKDVTQFDIVQDAIADLYRAVGEGYSLMLPVRDFKNSFFSDILIDSKNEEPNFWDGPPRAQEKTLGAHYVAALNDLSAFIKLTDDERTAKINSGQVSVREQKFYDAYIDGQTNAAWAKPVKPPKIVDITTYLLESSRSGTATPSSDESQDLEMDNSDLSSDDGAEIEKLAGDLVEQTLIKAVIEAETRAAEEAAAARATEEATAAARAAEEAVAAAKAAEETAVRAASWRKNPSAARQKPLDFNLPDSYKKLVSPLKKPLHKARAVLNDYTKGNSKWQLFIHGHWNRHHVAAVAEIVKDIDNNKIQTTDELMEKLHAIKLVNPKGSLARRIQFLKSHLHWSPTEQEAPQRGMGNNF